MFIPTHEIPVGIFFIVVLFFPVQFFIKMVGMWWECGGNVVGKIYFRGGKFINKSVKI